MSKQYKFVGLAGVMPGTTGFTMGCFTAADVPHDTMLYIEGDDDEQYPSDEDILAALNEMDINTRVTLTKLVDGVCTYEAECTANDIIIAAEVFVDNEVETAIDQAYAFIREYKRHRKLLAIRKLFVNERN